jgi:outer membrane protein assembly factor BamB/predicted phosphodiesterase
VNAAGFRTRSILISFLAATISFPSLAQQIRFAWLSDTHVGGSTGEEDLRLSVRDINRSDVRFVLISGDVTEYGSDAQLRLAKSILDSLRVDYHIIPGNHDTKWSESGTMCFPRLWGSDKFAFTVDKYLFVGMHQGPRMRMADGHWAPEDLRWLDTLLASALPPDRPIIFVTHYPVDSSITNWYEALDRLKRKNLSVVLVGHGHNNRILSFEGIPAAMARSNLRAVELSGGYTLGTIQADTLTLSERHPGARSDSIWFSVPLNNDRLAERAVARPRPSFALNKSFPNVRVLWEFSSGYTIASGAAAAGGKVFFGNASGSVYCLDGATGRLIWKASTGGPVFSTPCSARGLVIVGSADSTLRCLDAGTGAEVWARKVDGAVLGAPSEDGGVVYIGSSDRAMRAVELTTGKILWAFHGLGGFVETKPLILDGKILFGAWDSHFYALDALTGRLKWVWEGDNSGVLYSPAACWPVGSKGAVYIVAPDRKMTAIDVDTGRQLWRTAAHQVRETIGISEGGERLYVRTMRDTIMALTPSRSGPVVDWVATPGFGYDINSAMIVEKGGTVFYGTKNGVLYALRASTGLLIWAQRVGVSAINTLAAIDNRSVIATDFDGVVRLVRGDPP